MRIVTLTNAGECAHMSVSVSLSGVGGSVSLFLLSFSPELKFIGSTQMFGNRHVIVFGVPSSLSRNAPSRVQQLLCSTNERNTKVFNEFRTWKTFIKVKVDFHLVCAQLHTIFAFYPASNEKCAQILSSWSVFLLIHTKFPPYSVSLQIKLIHFQITVIKKLWTD